MKTYNCKITFKSICDESDLKNHELEIEHIYKFIRNNFWNVGTFKFEFKENKTLTKKDKTK